MRWSEHTDYDRRSFRIVFYEATPPISLELGRDNSAVISSYHEGHDVS